MIKKLAGAALTVGIVMTAVVGSTAACDLSIDRSVVVDTSTDDSGTPGSSSSITGPGTHDVGGS